MIKLNDEFRWEFTKKYRFIKGTLRSFTNPKSQNLDLNLMKNQRKDLQRENCSQSKRKWGKS